ncbi:hypothetical protein M885DRAFT_626624 [Pelagophyceae sp. CCMP2097]|nr:hypothetical protein M885DRAFT_626624 [Pelagophyceae sp. CCMP2097]
MPSVVAETRARSGSEDAEDRRLAEPPFDEPWRLKGRFFDERRDLDQIPRRLRLQNRQKSPIGLSLVQLEEIGLLGTYESASADADGAVARQRPPELMVVPTAVPVSAARLDPAGAAARAIRAARRRGDVPCDADAARRAMELTSRDKRKLGRDAQPDGDAGLRRQQRRAAAAAQVPPPRRRPLSAAPHEAKRASNRPASASSRVLRPEGWAAPTPDGAAAGARQQQATFESTCNDLDDIVEDDGGGDEGADPFEEHLMRASGTTAEAAPGDADRARDDGSGVASSTNGFFGEFARNERDGRSGRSQRDDAEARGGEWRRGPQEPQDGSDGERTQEPQRRRGRPSARLERTLRALVVARRRTTPRSLQQIFAHFDRRARRAFDARDLLEGLGDLGVEATAAEARDFARRLSRDGARHAGAPLVRFGEFATFVDDADHDALEDDVCKALARRLVPPGPADDGDAELPPDADDGEVAALEAALGAAFGARSSVDRRAFARGLAQLGLDLDARRAHRLVVRFDCDGDGACSPRALGLMVLRSRAWADGAALARARRGAAAEAGVAAELRARSGRWPDGLTADLASAARALGLRVFSDRDLLWIARDAARGPLPPGWAAAHDGAGRTFYHDRSGASRWARPVAERYELLALEAQRTALSRRRAAAPRRPRRDADDADADKASRGRDDATLASAGDGAFLRPGARPKSASPLFMSGDRTAQAAAEARARPRPASATPKVPSHPPVAPAAGDDSLLESDDDNDARDGDARDDDLDDDAAETARQPSSNDLRVDDVSLASQRDDPALSLRDDPQQPDAGYAAAAEGDAVARRAVRGYDDEAGYDDGDDADAAAGIVDEDAADRAPWDGGRDSDRRREPATCGNHARQSDAAGTWQPSGDAPPPPDGDAPPRRNKVVQILEDLRARVRALEASTPAPDDARRPSERRRTVPQRQMQRDRARPASSSGSRKAPEDPPPPGGGAPPTASRTTDYNTAAETCTAPPRLVPHQPPTAAAGGRRPASAKPAAKGGVIVFL